MEILFEKYQALGNDFVIIADLASQLSLSGEEVVNLCDRHFGIGADGLIVVRPSGSPPSTKERPDSEAKTKEFFMFFSMPMGLRRQSVAMAFAVLVSIFMIRDCQVQP